MRCWEVSKTLDGIIVNAMRFMAFYSWASICLSTSRETNSAGGDQTTGALVERQVYCEQDITPIVIEVHRQVDEGRVTGCIWIGWELDQRGAQLDRRGVQLDQRGVQLDRKGTQLDRNPRHPFGPTEPGMDSAAQILLG